MTWDDIGFDWVVARVARVASLVRGGAVLWWGMRAMTVYQETCLLLFLIFYGGVGGYL